MQPLKALIARRTAIAGFTLALATLAACGDYGSNTSYPTAPNPDPTPTTVEVAFCNGAQPQWVAFQDGDGEWTRAQPVVTGQLAIFLHTFNSNRAAVATAREFVSGLKTVAIQYGAPAELAIAGDQRPDLCGVIADDTVIGTVAGIDTNEVAVVSTGRSTREATTVAEGSAFVLRQVGGPQELLATRLTRVDDDVFLTGIILRRGPELADGATLPVLDFDSDEAIHPIERGLTLAGFGPDGAVSRNGIRTAHSDNVIIFGNPSVTAANRPYWAVPVDRLAPTDLQFISANTNVANTSNVQRVSTVYFRNPVARTITFPEAPHAPAVSVVATAPTIRLRARFDSQAAYDRATGVSFQDLQNTVIAVSMTPAYAARNATGYDLVVPELSGVAGFDPRWSLRGGVTLLWTSSRVGGSLGLAPGVVPADGDTRVAGSDAGFITP